MVHPWKRLLGLWMSGLALLAGCIDRVIFRIRAQPDHGESEAAAH